MRKARHRRARPASRKTHELTETGRQTLETLREQVRNAQSLTAIVPIAGQVQSYTESDRPELLRELARDLKEDALPLMRELMKVEDRDLLLATLEATGLVASDESAEIISPVAAEAEIGEVRKAARRALEHLRSLGIDAVIPMGTGALTETGEEQRFREALVSSINGLGQRFVILSQRIPGAGIAAAQFALDDINGVYDIAVGVVRRHQYDRMMDLIRNDPGRTPVTTPWDYGLHVIEEARKRNEETHTPLPEEFDDARSMLGDAETTFDESIIYDHIDKAEMTDNKVLLTEGEKLLDLDIFRFWQLPDEVVEKTRERLKEMKESWVVVSEAAQEDRQANLIRDAIDEYFDEGTRSRYKRRLEEMAYILHESDKESDARVALATAVALRPDGPQASMIPFFQALMQRSMESQPTQRESSEEEPEERSRIIVPFRDLPQTAGEGSE